MASLSNMVQSLIRKTSKSLDLCQSTCPTQSCDATCNPNTAIPSCSYAQPVLPNIYLFEPSVKKRSSIELLNKQIIELLKEKLIYHVLNGEPTDSIEYHCRLIVEELSDWMGQKVINTYDGSYRDELITYLAGSTKQAITDVPVDETDWIKLLNGWIRNNSSDDIIFNRKIYQILAVDGFYGFKPKDLKKYLDRISIFLRPELGIHAKGVRAMYEFFDENSKIKSLTGTFSACVVFIALLNIYSRQMKKELFDDQVRFQVQQTKSWAEGYLHRHSDYYRDVKNVNEEILESLENVYSEQFTDKKKMKVVGKELFKLLSQQILN